MDPRAPTPRRAPAGAARPPADLEARFRLLVQSPLRAALLRFLAARPDQTFDIEALMQAFGRMRHDVDNCLRELTDFGVVRLAAGPQPRYRVARPLPADMAALVAAFVERQAAAGAEDKSAAVQRFRELLGRDEKMLALFEWVRTAAKSDIAVLILGPTGSGKELVANMIHELSRRNAERLQALNCAALPDALFESEIFGYERAAFGGDGDQKAGSLEQAHGGTLFLAEVADLSLAAQAKLLRVLEEKRFERLGGGRPVAVDFRLISATHRPLDQLVRESRFREDLFYRINAFSIRLPSLKERAADIPVLAERFLARYCVANGLAADAKQFSDEAAGLLARYHWPGNIRELESTVSRAALSAPGRLIRPADIEFLHGPALRRDHDPGSSQLPSLREAERAHIIRVLEAVHWNKLEAARVLAISRGTLYRKIDEYRLEPAGPRRGGRG